MSVRDLVKELCLFPFGCVLDFGSFSLLCVQFLTRLRMLLDLHLDKCNLFVTIVDHALGFGVVEEPLGQEIDRLLWLLLVHNGHALGDNLAQLLTLDIVSV